MENAWRESEKDLEDNIAKRKHIVEVYDRELAEVKQLVLLKKKENVKYNYGYYPIVVEGDEYSADELTEYLQKYEIYPRRYFYPAINDMPLFKDYNETPIAREISKKILCIPLYADLEEEQALFICSKIKEYFQNGK